MSSGTNLTPEQVRELEIHELNNQFLCSGRPGLERLLPWLRSVPLSEMPEPLLVNLEEHSDLVDRTFRNLYQFTHAAFRELTHLRFPGLAVESADHLRPAFGMWAVWYLPHEMSVMVMMESEASLSVFEELCVDPSWQLRELLGVSELELVAIPSPEGVPPAYWRLLILRGFTSPRCGFGRWFNERYAPAELRPILDRLDEAPLTKFDPATIDNLMQHHPTIEFLCATVEDFWSIILTEKLPPDSAHLVAGDQRYRPRVVLGRTSSVPDSVELYVMLGAYGDEATAMFKALAESPRSGFDDLLGASSVEVTTDPRLPASCVFVTLSGLGTPRISLSEWRRAAFGS